MQSHYCAQCGAPVLDAGDTFCGNCGQPLTQPPATGQVGQAVSAGMPVSHPPASGPRGALEVPLSLAPTVIAGNSAGAEAGAGAEVGIPSPIEAPLMGSAAARVFAQSGIPASMPTAVPASARMAVGTAGAPASGSRGTPPAPGPADGGLAAPIGYTGALTPETRLHLLTESWGVALAVVGTGGLAIFGLLLLLQPSHLVAWYWPWAVVSGFWLAAVILPRTHTLWTFLQVMGWNILLYAGLEVLLALVFRRFIVGRLEEQWLAAHPHTLLTVARSAAVVRQMFIQTLVGLIVVVVIASALGTALALSLAHWPRARRLPRRRDFTQSVGMPLLLVASAVLLYFAILVPLFALLANRLGEGLALAWAYVIPMMASFVVPVLAAWLARRALRRAASQPRPAQAGFAHPHV